jgi:hypothetical protein
MLDGGAIASGPAGDHEVVDGNVAASEAGVVMK